MSANPRSLLPHHAAALALRAAAALMGGLLVAFVGMAEARAQSCSEPLCSAGDTYARGGTDYIGAYGVCRGCNWLGHCSHQITRCPTGRTLDVTTGTCELDACGGGGCGTLAPLCGATETYATGGTDATGPYGICQSFGGWPGFYRSHRIARCRAGWTLQASTGQCRRDCPRQPDLWIRRVFLKDRNGVRVSSVPAYQPYYACFEVANIGLGTSPNFVVRGGGLAVSPAPQQTQYRLTPGQRREGCLYYRYTPHPGTWNIQLTVDPDRAVPESNDGNNSRNLRVVIR